MTAHTLLPSDRVRSAMSDINTPEPPSGQLISDSTAMASAEASIEQQDKHQSHASVGSGEGEVALDAVVPLQGAEQEVPKSAAALEGADPEVASAKLRPPEDKSSGEGKDAMLEQTEQVRLTEPVLHDPSLQPALEKEGRKPEDLALLDHTKSSVDGNAIKLEEPVTLESLPKASTVGDKKGFETPATLVTTHTDDTNNSAIQTNALQAPLRDDQDEKPIITNQSASDHNVDAQEDTSMREDMSADAVQTGAATEQPPSMADRTETSLPDKMAQSASEEAALPSISSVLPNLASSGKQNVAAASVADNTASTSQGLPILNGPAAIPTDSYSSGIRRRSPGRASTEAQERARQEEADRLQRESEDMRLMWLSLPANDHLTYYSETEDDASSSANEGNGMAPKGAYGGMPLLSRTNLVYGNGKRKRQDWLEDERERSDSDDEDLEMQEKSEERRFRTGNRGNKLLKGSRWNRRRKLGLWTEAKNEKEMHDRFMSRVKTIQRAGVESLLQNAPGPKVIQGGGPVPRDMLEGSDRMLLKDASSNVIMEENLQSTSLAPALLRPILSARALLESHTLRHTFRNPHIGALSKTALDLRESEGNLSRALGRCFSAMERMSAYVDYAETGEVRVNGSRNTDFRVDPKAIGAEGTAGTADEVNPALVQLDDLFVTRKGLPIPVVSSEGGEEQARHSTEMQAILTTNQQRDVIRAALECLQDLGQDSLEYVERLDEVRGRLEGVKRSTLR